MEVQPSFKTTPWYRDDPRFHIDKRADIVVLFSDETGYHKHAAAAAVETKHGWNISFSQHHKDHGTLTWFLNSDDSWPEGWVWTYQP